MKKLFSLALAMLLVTGLAACGSSGGDAGKTVDLAAYYDAMSQELSWGEDFMIDVPEEMLDTSYPGLRDIETKQFIAKAPAMSAVVSEVVLLECSTPEDAQKAADILQARVDEQAGGGAWYPESVAAWEAAQVSVNGNYAAMLVSSEGQKTLSDAYSALFA